MRAGHDDEAHDAWLLLFNDSSGTFRPEDASRFSYTQLMELSRRIMTNASDDDEHHIDDPEFDYLRHSQWRALVVALYIVVMVIGIAGNSIVVYVVAQNKNMHNVTNIFIANLALSDIGLCVFSLPVQLYYQLTDHWAFGDVMCRVVFTAFAVPMYVSTLTIFLIAFDRYWLIVYPLNCRMSVKAAVCLIALGFVVSLTLAIPVICFTTLHHLHDPVLDIDRKYCVEKWPNATARISYSLAMFFFQFFLPLCMTALLYYKIYCRLRRRPAARVTQNERTSRTNKILFAIVLLFIVCWLPWNMYSLVAEIDQNLVRGAHFKITDLCLKLFAMSSSGINPFLYCWLNDNFRKEFDSLAIKLHLLRSSSLSRGQRSPHIQYHLPAPTTGIGHSRHAIHVDAASTFLSPGLMFTDRASRISISQCQSTAQSTLFP